MPDWRFDKRWRLLHYEQSMYAAPPEKPTISAERSADGKWASVYDYEDGQPRIIASWMLVGMDAKDLAELQATRGCSVRTDTVVRDDAPVEAFSYRSSR